MGEGGERHEWFLHVIVISNGIADTALNAAAVKSSNPEEPVYNVWRFETVNFVLKIIFIK